MAYFYKTIVKNINNNDVITLNDYLAFLSKGDTCAFEDKKVNIKISGIVTKIHHDILVEYNADNAHNIHQTVYIDVY